MGKSLFLIDYDHTETGNNHNHFEILNSKMITIITKQKKAISCSIIAATKLKMLAIICN